MKENNGTTKLNERVKNLIHDVYDKKDDAMNKLIDIMTYTATVEIKNVFLKNIEKNKKLDKDEIDLLGTLLHAYNLIYTETSSSTGISDAEYDILVEYYRDHTKELLISEELVDSDSKIHHRFPSMRGTLDKIYKLTDEDVIKNKSQKSIADWVNSTSKRLSKNGYTDYVDLWDEKVYVFPKFDGVSCIFECRGDGTLIRALSRGDTERNLAEDYYEIFKDSFKGPIKDTNYDYAVKTEVMMSDSNFAKYQEDTGKTFKNTRSAVVSAMKNSEELGITDPSKYLTPIPLRISFLDDNGNETDQDLAPGVFGFPFISCKLGELDKIRKFAMEHRTVLPGFRCDGAVIYLQDKKLRKVLGRENHKQKSEVAYKFTEESTYSKVATVNFTTGLFGRITPVVEIEPVKLKGNKITNASLGSYQRFKELELAEGDTVKVVYDIIPYVIYDENDTHCKRSGNEPIKAPVLCPECWHELQESETGNMLTCINPNCSCRLKGKILNYIEKMNIMDISYATVNDFFNAGLLMNIVDLYSLKDKKKKLMNIDGYDKKKINNIIEEIDKKKTVTTSVFLGSLGIEGCSFKTFRNILKYISYDDLIDYCVNDITDDFHTLVDKVPGVKEVTASKIVKGIRENETTIIELEDILTIIPEKPDSAFSVVFTKVRDDDAESFIKDNGGEVSDSLTKNTSLLVVPANNISSSKVTKANNYNIPIVTIDEMKDYIKEHFIH